MITTMRRGVLGGLVLVRPVRLAVFIGFVVLAVLVRLVMLVMLAGPREGSSLISLVPPTPSKNQPAGRAI